MSPSVTSNLPPKKVCWDVKHHPTKGFLLTWSYWRPTTNVRHEYAWKDDTIHYQTKKSILDHLKKFFDTTDHKAVLKLVNDRLKENKRIEEQDEEDEVQEKLAFLENKVIELSKEVDGLKSKYLVRQASQVPPPPVPPPPPVFDESYNDEYTAVPRPTLIVPVVYESGDDDSSSDYEPEIEEEEEDDDDISQAPVPPPVPRPTLVPEGDDSSSDEEDSVYDSDDNADDTVDGDDNDKVDASMIKYEKWVEGNPDDSDCPDSVFDEGFFDDDRLYDGDGDRDEDVQQEEEGEEEEEEEEEEEPLDDIIEECFPFEELAEDSVYDSDDNADDNVDNDDNDAVDQFIQYLEVIIQKVEADFENPDNIPVDDDDTYNLYAELCENYLYGVKEHEEEHEEENVENNYVNEDSDSGYGNYDDEFIKYLDSVIDGNI